CCWCRLSVKYFRHLIFPSVLGEERVYPSLINMLEGNQFAFKPAAGKEQNTLPRQGISCV
ncbi:hypothetical protein OFC62_33200, partial [Escherichia coli]|nr:hypothetical protein [Escherichia coli]